MSNNKQSSIEWLWSELRDKFNLETGEMYNSNELVLTQILEQAKAIHEKETIDFSQTWAASGVTKEHLEYFYNETFNNNEQQ